MDDRFHDLTTGSGYCDGAIVASLITLAILEERYNSRNKPGGRWFRALENCIENDENEETKLIKSRLKNDRRKVVGIRSDRFGKA